MNFFQRRKILKHTNALDLIPVRMHRHEEDPGGLVTILVPKFRNRALAKFFLPAKRSPDFHIRLDEHGSALWLAIDGGKDVRAIITVLRKQFGDKIEPAEQRVTMFISRLYQQRYILFRQILENV